jgi:general secretion pathway protein M
MSTNRPALRPEQAWLLLAALVLIALVAGVATFALRTHARAAQTLTEIEPRYARISGLLQKQEQIEQASQVLTSSMGRYVYPPEGDSSQIGNQALQKVRDLASARNLRVTSSQSQPAKEDNDHPGLNRIAINLRIEGDWNGLQELLAELPRQVPVIYQNTLQLMVLGGGRSTDPNTPLIVSGQFDLYVLQERKADAPAPGAAQGPALSGAGAKRGTGL